MTIEDWQRDPRRVAETLVERGSRYDIKTLEAIYDDDQHLIFVDDDGRVRRMSRDDNMALFRNLAESGAEPLLPEAEILHVEETIDSAVVLIRRKMNADESSRLFELRLRKHGDIWKVSGETISPWAVAGA